MFKRFSFESVAHLHFSLTIFATLGENFNLISMIECPSQEMFIGVADVECGCYLNCDVLFAQKFDLSRLNHGSVRSFALGGKTIEWEAGSCTKSAVLDWLAKTDLQVFRLEVGC